MVVAKFASLKKHKIYTDYEILIDIKKPELPAMRQSIEAIDFLLSYGIGEPVGSFNDKPDHVVYKLTKSDIDTMDRAMAHGEELFGKPFVKFCKQLKTALGDKKEITVIIT